MMTVRWCAPFFSLFPLCALSISQSAIKWRQRFEIARPTDSPPPPLPLLLLLLLLHPPFFAQFTYTLSTSSSSSYSRPFHSIWGRVVVQEEEIDSLSWSQEKKVKGTLPFPFFWTGGGKVLNETNYLFAYFHYWDYVQLWERERERRVS